MFKYLLIGLLAIATPAAAEDVIEDQVVIGAVLWRKAIGEIPEACVAEIRAINTPDAQSRPGVMAEVISGTVFQMVSTAEMVDPIYDEHLNGVMRSYKEGRIDYSSFLTAQRHVQYLRDQTTASLKSYLIRFPSCKFLDHLKPYRAARRALG